CLLHFSLARKGHRVLVAIRHSAFATVGWPYGSCERGTRPTMLKMAALGSDGICMDADAGREAAEADPDRHICCTLTNVVLGLTRQAGGEAAVGSLLERAATKRQASYLEDIDNWISLEEACALLAAGVHQTNDPRFARCKNRGRCS